MRIHYLQHVAFEGPGFIEDWTRQNGHTLKGTKLYAGEPPPDIQHIDWLIVLGGPMNVYEEADYPWLIQEKAYIADAVKKGLPILGICLGAQLIADQLGGRVTSNRYKEIGWFPVSLTEDAGQSQLFGNFPMQPLVFHWHGDTFNLPPGARRIASSPACPNQAFVYNDRVIGLQFHLESTEENIDLLLKNCAHDMEPDAYVQSEQTIRSSIGSTAQTKELLYILLDEIARLPS